MSPSRFTDRLKSFFRGGSSSSRTPARRSSAAAPEPSGRSGVSFEPKADGQPDPGEVVWAWVAYEDDPQQGKDRPVLLIGRDGDQLLGLQLTSKDHDRDAEQEARAGRFWMDVGTGAWDREHRPSEVRLNRLLHLEPDAVRREGAAMERQVFDRVVTAARQHLKI